MPDRPFPHRLRDLVRGRGSEFVVAEADVRHRAPAHFDDELEIVGRYVVGAGPTRDSPSGA